MARSTDWHDYIRVDSGICHGKPCFRGTRIMVSTVLEFLEDGADFAEIKSSYPALTRAHVRAALGFAREALDSGRYVAFTAARHALPR